MSSSGTGLSFSPWHWVQMTCLAIHMQCHWLCKHALYRVGASNPVYTKPQAWHAGQALTLLSCHTTTDILWYRRWPALASSHACDVSVKLPERNADRSSGSVLGFPSPCEAPVGPVKGCCCWSVCEPGCSVCWICTSCCVRFMASGMASTPPGKGTCCQKTQTAQLPST